VARWRLFVLSVVLGLVPVVRADAPLAGPPPTPSEWVTDSAGALREETRSSLSRRLSAYAESSGHQVLVWIGETTGDVPLEEFTARAFERWKVGRKGIDDGIVVFLFVKDRKVRIEVGYGLEDKVPDALASRIIRETFVPRIRAGDMDGAVSAGVETIVAHIDGKLPPERGLGHERAPPAFSLLQIILLVLGGLALIAFLVTHPSLAAFFLVSFLSQGRRGGGAFGGGGFGGGFSGGGGRSGGGGASGSW
jgi:uncharacterized protein